jgi:hypothetical protein
MEYQGIAALEERIIALQFQLDRLQWRFRCPQCGHGNRSTALGDLRPREVILHFLKQLDNPVGINSLKKMLAEGGYPMERFGPRQKYYYTILGRLVDAGKILRPDNGDEIMLAG